MIHSQYPSIINSCSHSIRHSHYPIVIHSHCHSMIQSNSPSIIRSHSPSMIHSHFPRIIHSHCPNMIQLHSPSILHSHSQYNTFTLSRSYSLIHEYPPTGLLSDCGHDCNMRVGNVITCLYIQIADIDKFN